MSKHQTDFAIIRALQWRVFDQQGIEPLSVVMSPNTVKSPSLYPSDRKMTIRWIEDQLGRVQRLPSMPYPSA